jgi:hypothetical protein
MISTAEHAKNATSGIGAKLHPGFFERWGEIGSTPTVWSVVRINCLIPYSMK